ncbi:MAG TPA: peptidoglycan-binding protein [Cyclobacteriaceae bacterium]|nr:peptidoglycan-binding protein [Cyclobacteriaceae bacterium]
MLTPTQKKTAESIINIFETGSVQGDYSMVTLIAGDTGHLTYGRSQTTLGSGNLHLLLKQYVDNAGARFKKKLAPFLSRFANRDFSLDHDPHLHNILRASADDPVMRETQDLFFDHTYWKPAFNSASQLGIRTPLGYAVIYDSMVHGSGVAMRNHTNSTYGSIATLGEREWVKAYVHTRRHWLATHSRSDLRQTVYRMDAFQRLIDLELWGLELPLIVRGKEISHLTLTENPKGCYDGPIPGSRHLTLQSPVARGLDVRLLQLGLSEDGINVLADGIYGNASATAVKIYQNNHGLPVTGIADIPMIANLSTIREQFPPSAT